MKPSVTSKLPADSNEDRLKKFYEQFSVLYKSEPDVHTPDLPIPFFASILLQFRPLIPAECMAKEHKYEGNFFPT